MFRKRRANRRILRRAEGEHAPPQCRLLTTEV
jgi:hypothetical protein